ncbi:TetR/AcrR family transcriptional regulator [Nocardia alni]|uniref:TetR/AcrR family transcriptional regulator n=1 Tax=Nocardia alni TaxID=2815723 RepID=UPI001C245453|nr:TetR/AcrR family transcriptional regulator [Nocardia alni]
MAEDVTTGVPRRRRGKALEEALLDAAWQELAEVGFAKLTMESVATRAKTGVAVLYRRWPRKDDLVVQAISHYRANTPVAIPDTGNLRDDLLALFTRMNDSRGELITSVSATFAGLYDSCGLTPADVRHRVLDVPGEIPDRDEAERPDSVFRRAHDRGELDLTRVPREILDVPFDLIRHDLLMTLEPVSPERITMIVDGIFLPLLEKYRGQ